MMISRLKITLMSILFVFISFSLLAGEGKQNNKIPIKTKHGKAVLTKKGEPVTFKTKGKK